MFLKKFLLDCLFPKQCYGCKQAATWLCLRCLKKIKAYQGQVPRHLKDINNLIIASEYDDKVVQELIQAFKFNFNKDLAVPLTVLLYQRLKSSFLKEDYLIIPIPLFKKRLNWRGFNQSELIAKELSILCDWPLSLDLIKIKNTREQAGLKEKQRLDNQKGVFKWRGKNLANQDIILLDDIITSGATISEAATILKSAGANRIIAIAIAKG